MKNREKSIAAHLRTAKKPVEVRSTILYGVKIIRKESGRIQYLLPTTMGGEGFRGWADTHAGAIAREIAAFDKPKTYGEEVTADTLEEARGLSGGGGLPYEDRTHEDKGL